MRRLLAVSLLALLAFVPFGAGAPTQGSMNANEKVGEHDWTTTKSFNGGERASVLVIGDHHATPHLEVSVYDAKDKLVAADRTDNEKVADFVGVVWYPPRTGEYRIVVRNPHGAMAQCYIAIK